MALENKWVGYLQRGYLQIKNSILNRVRSSVPEITDFSESNILVIIVSMFSGMVEQLNYYIDQLLRESFVTTARRYTSLVRHARTFDYRIKAANPASTVLTVTFIKNGEPYNLQTGENESIPKGTLFVSNGGLYFYSTKDVIGIPPNNFINVPVSQYKNEFNTFTIPSTDPNQEYLLGDNYVHNSMELLINGIPWQQVTTFGKSIQTDFHYVIDIGLDGNAYIRFGDDIRGAIPPLNGVVETYYKSTSGPGGNLVVNEITNPPIVFWQFVVTVEVNNANPATGGTFYETIESLRRNIPLSLRTLERAVTRQDYVDVAKLHPGVNTAYVKFDCGKFVYVYVAPMGGGVAQIPLLDSVTGWFENYRMVTTFVEAKAAGEADILLELDIVGKFRMGESSIREQVEAVLLKEYGHEKSSINRSLRKSDIYALVDNQTTVDYLNIKKLALKPFFFPDGHNDLLLATLEIVSISHQRDYRIVYVSGNQFQLHFGGAIESNLTVGVQYSNEFFKLTINSSNYIQGSIWEFRVFPNNQDIVINDYSIPVLKLENLVLNITETIIQ